MGFKKQLRKELKELIRLYVNTNLSEYRMGQLSAYNLVIGLTNDNIERKKTATRKHVGVQYTDSPRLKNDNDLYYKGCGTDWGVDLDGKRYYKRYDCTITAGNDRFIHLKHGDFISEEARIKEVLMKCLKQLGLLEKR